VEVIGARKRKKWKENREGGKREVERGTTVHGERQVAANT